MDYFGCVGLSVNHAKIDPASLTAWYFSGDMAANNGNLAILIVSLFFTSFHNLPFMAFAIAILAWLIYQYARNFKALNFEQKKQRAVLAIWAFLLPATGAMVGVLTVKFYILAAPALYLVVGEGLTAGSAKYAKSFWLALAAAGLFLLPSALLTSTEATFSWRIFTNYIEQNETKESLIMITPFNEELPLKQYYRGQTPIAGLYLRDDNFSLMKESRYNWNQQTTNKMALAEWTEKNYWKKNILHQPTDEYDWMHQILKNMAGNSIKIQPGGFINICLFEFRKN